MSFDSEEIESALNEIDRTLERIHTELSLANGLKRLELEIRYAPIRKERLDELFDRWRGEGLS